MNDKLWLETDNGNLINLNLAIRIIFDSEINIIFSDEYSIQLVYSAEMSQKIKKLISKKG